MIISLLITWLPALTLFLAVAVQELALPFQAWSVFRPNLVLLGLFYWRLYRPDRCSTGTAFAAGLMVDLVSGGPLGLNPFSKVLIVLIVGHFGSRLRAADFSHLLPVLLLLALLEETLQMVLMAPLHSFHLRWPLLLGRPVATVLVAPLVISFLIHLHRSWLEVP